MKIQSEKLSDIVGPDSLNSLCFNFFLHYVFSNKIIFHILSFQANFIPDNWYNIKNYLKTFPK